ncbi:hypothetical protein BT96DRAFT_667704 [Gymnopus androsaceus JB14]|uniref:Uncharacterized protein n=1 Tax=Gymnopus androsaceus JB14 TaxID=1447944 RepID=A0A6A4IJ89_9AGAR|nr:hypothetical protein BT96DRAFT_667704 [Gymnopus androsaceus JB14]
MPLCFCFGKHMHSWVQLKVSFWLLVVTTAFALKFAIVSEFLPIHEYFFKPGFWFGHLHLLKAMCLVAATRRRSELSKLHPRILLGYPLQSSRIHTAGGLSGFALGKCISPSS